MEKFYDEVGQDITLATVYTHLCDEESKKIYRSRSLYSLTNETCYMREMIRESVVGRYLLDIVRALDKNKKILLFGAGKWGKAILEYFPEIEVYCVVDNHKAGQKINNINIVSPVEIMNVEDKFVIISIMFEYKTVQNQLSQAGIRACDMLALGEFVNQHQYFDSAILPKARGNYVFVDCGAYKGETALRFLEWCGRNYKKIYVFEPHPTLYEECKKI